MIDLVPEPVQRPSLEQALDAVRGLQRSVADVIETLPGPPRREPDLRGLLMLNKKLSWSIFTVAESSDTTAAVAAIPGERAFQRFLDAAASGGAASVAVQRAATAFARFEAAIRPHARGRQDFEAMVRAASGTQGADSFTTRHRLAAFRSNALLWGRQCRVVTSTAIIAPSATPGYVDRAFIRGVHGLHCTTPGLSLLSAMGTRHLPNPATPPQPSAPMAIDPRERRDDAPGLMLDFCSDPLPRFEMSIAADGRPCHVFHASAVGLQASVDLVFGHFARASNRSPAPPQCAELVVSHAVTRPTETFVRDILIHRSLWEDRLPESRVYAPPMDGSGDVHEIDRMPIRDPVESLGVGAADLRVGTVPRYADTVRYAFEQLAWDPDEFRVFRSLVEYPVLHSWLRLVLTPRRPAEPAAGTGSAGG